MESTIEYLNLYSLLKAYGQKGLQKVECYGVVKRKLDRPSNLQASMIDDPNGIFVEMELFAINLKSYEAYLRSNGFYNKDGIYMVRGSIVTFVANNTSLGVDWFSVRGTLRLGSRDITDPYTCMFNFRRNGSQWHLDTTTIDDLDITHWDKRGACYQWIQASNRQGAIIHPKEVLSLPRVSSTLREAYAPVSQSVKQESQVLMPTTNINYLEGNFKREDRQTIKERSKFEQKLKVSLLKAKSSREDFIKNLVIKYGYSPDCDIYLDYMIKGLDTYLKNKPNPQAMTGRMILKKYLNNFSGSSKKYIAGKSASEYLCDIWGEVAHFIVDNTSVITADGVAWDLCKSAFGWKDLFYLGVVSVICGLSFEDVEGICSTCRRYKLSIIRILNENPYILQFISNLDFKTIEKLAIRFNRHNDKQLSRYKNVAMLNAYIEDTSDGSTVFTKDSLSRANIGVSLTPSSYNKILSDGMDLTTGQYYNVKSYIKDVNSKDLGYVLNGFKKVGFYYIKPLDLQSLLNTIKDYNESGLGVVQDNYVTSSSLLNKELFVYNTMYALGSTTHNYDVADIDRYITEYEGVVGFGLEPKQRDAVHLCISSAFIVAGSAGSGKTTVSNCIVYVLKKLEPNLELRFIAPTGKAAKRMQEVVKTPVKTIHSEFKLGLSKNLVISDDDEESLIKSRVAYFCDEGGMITIDTLYKALLNIDIEKSRFFIFGDFCQLPPIGKGLPFKNLLRFLPCVFLNVSKRASEGSKITANSNYVNEFSSPSNWHPLESGDDFFLLPCRSDTMNKVVYDLCAYYLGRDVDVDYIKSELGITDLPKIVDLKPDDIQVVTPLSKASYSWGSSKLNTLLQPLFNQDRDIQHKFLNQVTQQIAGTKFTYEDRVIHVDRNMYTMQWYSSYEDGQLQKRYGQGICNGDVGTIKTVLKAGDCDFYDEVEDCPEDFKYGDLRDDSTWRGDDKFFIVVEYWDYISESEFYILYRAVLNTKVQTNEAGVVLMGEDLNLLNLFYAGTTHKLQGSQAKLVICVIGDINFDGFITRQMVYTMFTRGEKLVFGVGSVGNESSSMLSKARKDIASANIKTIGEIIA